MQEDPESDLGERSLLRRNGPWLLIALVAVATIVGVLLVPDEFAQDPQPVSALPPATQTAPSLLSPAPADTAAETPAGPVATLDATARAGSMARGIIAEARDSGNVDLDAINDAAAQALASGAAEDAYLLFFFAARRGHTGAAMALGTEADPAHRDPTVDLFQAPDLMQAHKWYQLAADHGDPLARERLAELRARVERRAAQGDAEAQRISLLWQQ